MDNKIDFLAAAINDIQSTIRAIDAKVAALLVGILAPLASVNRVFAHLDRFANQSPRCLFVVIAISFLVMWVLALAALVRAIGAIDNPSQHIINADKYTGAFYAGGLFKLGIIDVFRNRKVIKALKDPMSFASQTPESKPAIEGELIFEQMKLAYIRDIKLKRLNWGMTFSVIWLFIGICIFLCSRYVLR